MDDNYIRLEENEYYYICNKIIDVFNPIEYLEVVLNYDYV